jgi:leucyl-tRNA synthetase
MPFIRYNQNLKTISRELRKNQTVAEIEMWNFLKANYPEHKFLRQKPLDHFVVDFYCLKKNLIIEVDGEIHKNQIEKDRERDNIFFIKYNHRTIRFTNQEVMKSKDYLKQVLDEVLH